MLRSPSVFPFSGFLDTPTFAQDGGIISVVGGSSCDIAQRSRLILSEQVISKADFIATVVNFDTESLTSAVIKTVEDVFKNAGDLTADAVNRASKACGPLYQVRRAALRVPGSIPYFLAVTAW